MDFQKLKKNSVLKKFFESGQKDFVHYQAIEKIKTDIEEESKLQESTFFELIFDQQLNKAKTRH